MRTNRILLAVFLIFTASVGLGAETLRLAADGKTDYAIALPDVPTQVEQTAASELASFLKQVTGADFPIYAESQLPANGGKTLFIGAVRSGVESKIFAQDQRFADDEILLETAEKSIYLTGNAARGPLYAVYSFLQDAVGCRWWTSTESTIPQRATLDIAPVHVSYTPKLLCRESFYRDPHIAEAGAIFSARMKLNGHFHKIPPEYGGHLPILYWAHSFSQILPPATYFAEHPEWYALIGGVRKGEQTQLCLTNEAMFQEFVKNTLEKLRANPGTKFVSVSQNDCGGWCQCEACEKLKAENHSQAGPLIHFVNQVAEAIEKEFPDTLVETLAYNESRFAPALEKPRDNVVVRLCTIECSFVTPLADGGRNEVFKENIEKWSAISKNLYIWDYVTNFRNYMQPRPNHPVIAPNIRFFIENHAVGLFEQGDAECAAGDFVRMRNWVIARLLWDPSLDQKALEDEFLAGYYSPNAAVLLREYLDKLDEAALQADTPLPCYLGSTAGWLDTATLLEATAIMDRAIEAAKRDEAADPDHFAGLTKKTERDSLPIRLVWIEEWPHRRVDLATHHFTFAPSNDMEAYYGEFRRILEENSVGSHREGGHSAYAQWLDELALRFGPPAPAPEVAAALPTENWSDVQEFEFRLAGAKRWVFVEEDAAASNQRAARMPGDHTQWAAAFYPAIAPTLVSPSGQALDENGRAACRVLLYARCDAADNADGSALNIGVYDEKNKKGLYGASLSVEQLKGSEYHEFDLGVFPLDAETLIWTAPVNRPDAVSNVYIDRIVLIRQ